MVTIGQFVVCVCVNIKRGLIGCWKKEAAEVNWNTHTHTHNRLCKAYEANIKTVGLIGANQWGGKVVGSFILKSTSSKSRHIGICVGIRRNVAPFSVVHGRRKVLTNFYFTSCLSAYKHEGREKNSARGVTDWKVYRRNRKFFEIWFSLFFFLNIFFNKRHHSVHLGL